MSAAKSKLKLLPNDRQEYILNSTRINLMNAKLLKVLIILLSQFGFLCSTAGIAQIADPTISVAGGPSTSPQTAIVTVSDTTTPVTIYYTTDGTTPTPSSATVTSGNTLLISQNAKVYPDRCPSPWAKA